ncbi:MAG: hypothetical protein APF83_06520 [Lutibacter sp. BRH_c52]|nr:MAG: hypothetical protein APF83_06520 [Lutibacter sp. BRH_c52]
MAGLPAHWQVVLFVSIFFASPKKRIKKVFPLQSLTQIQFTINNYCCPDKFFKINRSNLD